MTSAQRDHWVLDYKPFTPLGALYKRIKQLTKQLDKRIAQANVVPENLERIPPPVRKRRNN